MGLIKKIKEVNVNGEIKKGYFDKHEIFHTKDKNGHPAQYKKLWESFFKL